MSKQSRPGLAFTGEERPRLWFKDILGRCCALFKGEDPMMLTVNCRSILLVAAMACAAISLGAEEVTVETYPFPYDYNSMGSYPLAVGPDGDIWFGAPDPPRLMRISGELIQVVANEGFLTSSQPQLVFGPDGRLRMLQFDYFETPDWELFPAWLYVYHEESGVTLTDLEVPDSIWEPQTPFFAPDGTLYYWTASADLPGERERIYELTGGGPIYRFGANGMISSLAVSSSECWATVLETYGGQFALFKIDLSAGCVLERHFNNHLGPRSGPWAIDDRGRVWLSWERQIGVFDSGRFKVIARAPDGTYFFAARISADGTVWWQSQWGAWGLIRWRDGAQRLLTTDDGLLSEYCADPPVIDYDGRVWVLNFAYEFDYEWLGLSRISDGGWPPMRLMLHQVETEGTIAVEAQVINNGPVVGVDVYVALELNGQLLYWPNWQPAPHANQVNLRPGHNQTATIISAPRATVPPGTYTFWGCMTGRGTQKLIGPLDRKFESVIVTIPGD